MAIMNMLMMLVVAAILFCSHQQVTIAKEVVVVDNGNELLSSPFDILCQHWSWPYPLSQSCPPQRLRPRPRPRPRPQPCSPSPPPPPAPATTCSASDQQKVKTCMFDTPSIDACCPTFRSILGSSCPCYKYAEDLDNQILITLEAYCDVSTPCRGVQVIKQSKDE